MNNPIVPLERSTLYPNAGRVTPTQESDKEKDKKKFKDELEEELDEEERKKQAKRDTVSIGETDPLEPESNETSDEDASDGETQSPPRHIDLTA